MTEFTDMTDITDIVQQTLITDTHPHEAQHLSQSFDTSDKDKADKASEKVPAVEVELSGQHLIEASAGTGKTWTLTGIVLRLLIEARRAPEQIIATTFTRAAAAEMRQRIHERLVEFYQLLQWVNSLSADINNKAALYPEVLQVTPEKESNAETTVETIIETIIETEELNQDLDYDQQRKQKSTQEKRQTLAHIKAALWSLGP